MSFWDVVRFLCLTYLLVAFLGVIWWIAGDVLRNTRTSAVVKALWMGALLVMPFLTVFVYVVTASGGMSQRLAEREAAKGYPGYHTQSYARPANDDLKPVRPVMA
jgi:hypothetical protein